MITIFKNLPIFISACIIGVILYQSLMIAPSVNKLLTTQDASVYLRYIWPKFFIIISILSFISIVLIIYNSPDQKVAKILALSSFLLMVLCYVIIPFMNDAKDNGKESIFIFLHAASMIMTLITLIINFFIITCWKY